MLEKKLCEELRKNGYPQNSHTLYGSGRYYLTLPINKSNGDKTYEPTLHELIEACYKLYEYDFSLTFRKDINGKRENDKWLAGFQIYYDCHPSWEPVADGHTPEEAVARLWLALNKKD